MSKYKLSPWHGGSVKPVHKGFFQVKDGNKYASEFIPGALGKGKGFDAWRFWDGKKWKWVNEIKKLETAAFDPDDKWRGILK